MSLSIRSHGRSSFGFAAIQHFVLRGFGSTPMASRRKRKDRSESNRRRRRRRKRRRSSTPMASAQSSAGTGFKRARTDNTEPTQVRILVLLQSLTTYHRARVPFRRFNHKNHNLPQRVAVSLSRENFWSGLAQRGQTGWATWVRHRSKTSSSVPSRMPSLSKSCRVTSMAITRANCCAPSAKAQ